MPRILHGPPPRESSRADRSTRLVPVIPSPDSVRAPLALFVAALLATAPSPLPGQDREPDASVDELSGRVVDSGSGAPVSGARIVLEPSTAPPDGPAATPAPGGEPPPAETGGRLETLTDADGRFRLAPVPTGVHVLRVEHLTYGEHERRLQVEGDGFGSVEIRISPSAIELDPLVVTGDPTGASGAPGRPSSRNLIDREAIGAAASNGLTLSELLRREIPGIYVERSTEIGSLPCVEFRGARRGDGLCRPPQLILDGTSVPDPTSLMGSLSLDGIQQIRVIPPAEAGARFGSFAGWGVIVVETGRRSSLEDFRVPVVERRPLEREYVSWSVEPDPYPWARVYTAAFAGNAMGLLAGSAVLSQCMDLGTQRFYRGDDYCGAGLLLASGVAMAALPALGGSFAGRLAGSTPRSRGALGRSILHSLPVFVPGFAIVGLNSGSGGLQGTDVLGLALMVFGAPALNTLSDHYFRRPR